MSEETKKLKELGNRVVALEVRKGFRWMAGMSLCYGGFRVLSSVSNREHAIYGPDGEGDYEVIAADIYRMSPDLTDPATLGCLLALVREAYECPWLSVVGYLDEEGAVRWRIDAEGTPYVHVRDLHGFLSEAEALVAALEAAP